MLKGVREKNKDFILYTIEDLKWDIKKKLNIYLKYKQNNYMYLKMTELVEEFINIWINNCNMLSIQPYEFDKFIKIIDKLRKKVN